MEVRPWRGDVPKWLMGRFAKPYCVSSILTVTSKFRSEKVDAVLLAASNKINDITEEKQLHSGGLSPEIRRNHACCNNL